jgi:hypothetical protein
MPKTTNDGTRTPPRERYDGRPSGNVAVNISIDREARRILEQYAPSKKSYGSFVSRLLHMEKTRRDTEEQCRMVQEEQRG